MRHLAEWDELQVRLSGEKITEIVGQKVREQQAPISEMNLQFLDGQLTVTGKVAKFISVPFTIVIRKIVSYQTTVRVYLEQATAFGIPLPALLMKFVEQKFPGGEISYDPDTRSFAIQLDRFLPPFIDVAISEIRLIEDGVAVRLGPGGATPPLP
jgi:hypothetical protein